MQKRLKLGLICGGQSSEHEVSLQSVKFVLESVDLKKFIPYIIGIDKKGRWRLYEPGQKFLWHETDPKKIKLAPGWQEVTFFPGSQGKLFFLDQPEKKLKLDVVFPVLHGKLGEDGTIQGLFELAGVPYVGSGVLGSAVAMDKDMAKRLWRTAGLPVLNWFKLTQDKLAEFNEVKSKLGLPLFVKPANAGSSVGVSKVRNKKEYQSALKLAFKHDREVLVEVGLERPKEIEVSILEKTKNQLYASTPGEIRPKHEFYSYEAKYLDDNGAELLIPAELDVNIIKRFKQLAQEAFLAVGASGLARVDFFLDQKGKIYLNEINTMPGFTAISMYPKLLMHDGFSGQEIITQLVELALV